ncbi:MAG: serine/threonine protein kinase [Proteobacteria bacterium]|nr:serine/threonine protein kinase [Pseudomonadota bacterium]
MNHSEFKDIAHEPTQPELRHNTESSPQNADNAPPIQTAPDLKDRYRFIRRLGVGSQAHVYLAERLSDGKQVAIKQLNIDSVKTWKEYTLFHREAEVLSKLDIHGVVKFYEACDCLEAEPPCSYIVQEYIEGPTLKEVLKSGYRFSLSQICDLALQLFDIIEKLQNNDPPVIHRDIKPSNIILKTNDLLNFEVYLIDFGAVSNPQVQSGGSTIAGTYGYMSPEQNIGRAVPASDTYAIGVLVAYLLSGVEPLEMVVKDLRLIIDPYLENHPTALVQTLRRMIEPDIKARLSDISILKKQFTAFKNGIFRLDDKNSSPAMPDEELLKRMQDVKYLCQPRNLELWQALPDNPELRSPAPKQLFKTSPTFANYPIYKVKDTNNDIIDIIVLPLAILRVALVFIFLFAALMLPIIFLWFNNAFDHTNSVANLGCIIYTVICLIITVILFQKLTNVRDIIGPKTNNDLNSKRARIHYTNRILPQKCPEHFEIYQTGFKTIATITQIKYIPATDKSRQYPNISWNSYYLSVDRVEAPPTFRIWYKFNPPDDDNKYDIIHHIDTHIIPTGRFKVGDPLPILYTGIRSLARSPLHITQSMPFPIPIGDLNEPSDYIGTSNN